MSLAVRTYVRYAVPLTVLSALALAPLLYVALRTGVPADAAKARAQLRVAWVLGGAAIACQLLLVAGVAPALRAVAGGAPLSQVRALGAGLGSLARGLLPWLVAMAAVLLGGVALVVPGVLVLALVSLTGASERLGERLGPPLPAPIADSVAAVRAAWPRVALVLAAIVVVDLAIVFAVQTTYLPALGKKASAAQLASLRAIVRATALALVAVSPLAACALAATYHRSRDAERR